MTDPRPADQWSSRVGVILAVMGSAIGLGNFLRFPGLVAEYGGGHFMIPYFTAFVLLGMPIAWAEWSLGRFGGRLGYNSTPGIFQALWKNRASPYLGFLGLLVPVGIYMYYVYIEAWCLYYAFQYLAGGLALGRDPSAYAQYFVNFTGQGQDGILFTQGLSAAFIAVTICYALNFLIIYRGVAGGVELASRIGIPLLFLCALVVLARVLTLGAPDPAQPELNVINGLGFMWNPDRNGRSLAENLANADIWMAAAGQIFFSLSVGFGVIITYASYVKPKEDVTLSAATSASGNMFAEVALGGMITIPAAFMFLGAGAADASKSSLGLGFMTMPNIFAGMPLGNLIGFFWFFLLFLAAITSSISMLQPAIAFLEEGLGLGRKASVAMLTFITAVGTGLVLFFSANLKALDVMDFWIGTFGIFVQATILVILFGWVIGVERGMEEAHQGARLRIPNAFRFVIKYVAPVYLLTIFGVWLYQKAPEYIALIARDTGALYTILFVIFLSGFFLTLIGIAVGRWKKQSESRP